MKRVEITFCSSDVTKREIAERQIDDQLEMYYVVILEL